MPTESRRRVALALSGVFGRSYRVAETWDEGLSAEDAALAQALLGLCLRHWGRLHAWILPRLKNPQRGIPLGSHLALSMGLAQLAWMSGVSTHAAVHESVELAADPRLGFPPHKGLVNALLRQGAKDREALRRELEALPAALDRTPFAEEVLKAAVAAEHMEALWARLQRPPRPCFRALDDGPWPEGLVPEPALPGALRLEPGAAFPRPWLMAGQGMVQDLSSQALMSFAWNATPRRILDACAAPGGKTTALSRRWPQAELMALESDGKRAERLKQNLAVRRVKAHVEKAEAIAWLRETTSTFDLILLDAPCSGSGTLGKHPELTWLGDGLDLERLIRHQRAMIEAALPRLAPGGLLLYAVCSWLHAEGRHHWDDVRKSHPEFHSPALWPLLSDATFFRPDPLTWEGEGFQAFGLSRTEQP
ncbi:MAG: RsmB/NOP family class I SAM-dependent RNA methyltransferase [Firmicutes bacterium]|nr:RsmB/NOP family class I SAM-dependent RNA methyltransferase [Bacillota bacterium]